MPALWCMSRSRYALGAAQIPRCAVKQVTCNQEVQGLCHAQHSDAVHLPLGHDPVCHRYLTTAVHERFR